MTQLRIMPTVEISTISGGWRWLIWWLWPTSDWTYRHIIKHKYLITINSGNLRSQFTALKRVANINGCHSPTFRRKYKSRYSLESRHWYLSSDAINFHYFHTKGYFLKATFDQNNQLFFSSRHFMAHYESPCLGLKSRF